MSKESPKENTPEEEHKSSEELHRMNKKWYSNPYLLIASLILGPATFIGAFFIDYYTIWHSVVQSIVFLISAGFFVILFTYGFNWLWIYTWKDKTNRDYYFLTAIQAGIFISLIINAVQILKYISLEKSEGSSVFLILTIVYFVVVGILMLTTFLTVKKIQFPIEGDDFLYIALAILAGVIAALAIYFSIAALDQYAINHIFS